jgi:hypothetical protein
LKLPFAVNATTGAIAVVGLIAGMYIVNKMGSNKPHNIAVFKQERDPFGDVSSYDSIRGFDIKDYQNESPVYAMRTKHPSIVNSPTDWLYSNSSMTYNLPIRDNQMPLSGYIQTSPMP